MEVPLAPGGWWQCALSKRDRDTVDFNRAARHLRTLPATGGLTQHEPGVARSVQRIRLRRNVCDCCAQAHARADKGTSLAR